MKKAPTLSNHIPGLILKLTLALLIVRVNFVWAQKGVSVDSTRAVKQTVSLHPDSAQINVNPKNIKEQSKTVFDDEFVEDEKSLGIAIEENEKLLKNFPNDPFIASAMFQLSELYVRQARHTYRKEMVEYEREYKRFESGQRPLEPILPTIRLGKAIDLCYDILDRFPRVDFRDRIYYRLAICHLDEGNQDKSRKYFNQLVSEFPKSEYIAEAHFRIGEFFFNKRDFLQATTHYSELLQSWDCPYFNMALYKLGWSYYNIEDYVNSITTLVYLLSDIRLLEQSQAKVLGKTNSELRQEAIDYVAICFTEYGGAPEAKRFLIVQKKGSEDYNLQVFLKMGDIYHKRDYYTDAIATYEAILECWPFYQYAPVIQQKIVEAYEKDMLPDKAMESRAQLVTRYGPGSKWLNQYPEGQIRNDAIKQAEIALYDYAVYYQGIAQEKKRSREYLIAIDKYREFLKKFPRSEKAPQVNFYLAECLYEVEEYANAAEEYTKVLTAYGPNEHQEAASYNRILAYYNVLGKTATGDTLTFYLEDFLGEQNAQPDPIKVGHKLQKDLLQASNDFLVGFPKSEHLEEIYVKFAETLYNLHQYRLAAKVYERIIRDFKNGPYYVNSYSLLSQSYFQAGDFDAATRVGNEITKNFANSPDLIEKARKLVASSGFKKAETFSKGNEPMKAAASFANVALTTDDATIAQRAILRASAQYDSLKDFKKAARVLEEMASKRPELDFVPELLFRAATIYEREQEWTFAIIDYMKIVDKYQGFKLAAKAHYKSGVCYENLEKWPMAESTFKNFLGTTYAEFEADDYISAQFKIGEMKYNQKDFDAAIAAFQQTVRRFIEFKKAMKAADEYFPAKAEYLIAEICNDRFKQTQIAPPFDKTLAAKKELFNVTLKYYSDAVKFNIAEWATAALYKIGKLYEDYAVALISIPLQSELSPDQIAEQQARIKSDLHQQALKYYKANVLKAEKAEIQNEWVDLSRKRMQELIVELKLGDASQPQNDLSKTANKLN